MKDLAILTASFVGFGLLGLDKADAAQSAPTTMSSAPTLPSRAAQNHPTNLGTTPSSNSANATLPNTTGEISQTELVTRVRQDLVNDPKLSSTASGITIENDNGQITLRGTVPNQQTQQDLINRVSRTGGVSSVNNELTISNTQNR